MPAIHLFRRKWSFGSDDFVYPSIAEFVLRLIWLLVIVCTVAMNKTRAYNCDSGILFKIFYIGLLCTLAVIIPLSLMLMVASARGRIMDTNARRHVPLLLYMKLAAWVPELGWIIFGFYWAFFDWTNCDWKLVYMVRGVTITGIVFFFMNLVAVLFIFDPLGQHKYKRQSALTGDGMSTDPIIAPGSTHLSDRRERKVWERRCWLLCCGCIADGQEKEAFSSVADTLAKFFWDLDLVPSDLAAGLVLLRESERRGGATKSGLMSSGVLHAETREWPLGSEEEWRSIGMIRHFSRFASACYGWPLYVYSTLCTRRLCSFCSHCRCCGCCCGDSDVTVFADNPCECNMAVVLEMTGLPRDKFLYVDFHNTLYQSPFYVAIDDAYKAVVVAIRGTLSLTDALTDMMVESSDLTPDGLPNTFAHSGMLLSARFIRQKLKELGILDKAFEENPDYSLVVCGHSLGAGIATVLGLLMRQDYPHVKCYAYASPLGLVDEATARECQSFIVTVLLGYDIIPRLSMCTLEDLKLRLLAALDLCPEPKYRVLARCALPDCCATPPLTTVVDGDLEGLQRRLSEGTRVGEPLIRGSLRAVRDYRSNYDCVDHAPRSSVEQMGRLCSAGHIFQVLEMENADGLSDNPRSRCFVGLWSARDRFHSIIVHPQMFTDHLPERLDAALDHLLDQSTSNYNPMRCVNQVAPPRTQTL